jgi:hypothetical protein
MHILGDVCLTPSYEFYFRPLLWNVALSHCWLCNLGNEFTSPLPSNGCPSIVGHALVGKYLPIRCLAMRHINIKDRYFGIYSRLIRWTSAKVSEERVVSIFRSSTLRYHSIYVKYWNRIRKVHPIYFFVGLNFEPGTFLIMSEALRLEPTCPFSSASEDDNQHLKHQIFSGQNSRVLRRYVSFLAWNMKNMYCII